MSEYAPSPRFRVACVVGEGASAAAPSEMSIVLSSLVVAGGFRGNNNNNSKQQQHELENTRQRLPKN